MYKPEKDARSEDRARAEDQPHLIAIPYRADRVDRDTPFDIRASP